MVGNVSFVADAVIGTMLIVRKIGSGYETFVIGIITLPSVGAMVIMLTNSNFIRAPNVSVLFIILLLIWFVLYLLVLFMVLILLAICVCVTERNRESEMNNRPILYFEEKTS